MLGKIIKERYKVLDIIGSGTISDVYLGRDIQSREIVAIKALSPSTALEPGFERRFRREASILNDIHDPHIVRIYDFGVEDGQSYIIVEYVAGRTVAERLREEGTFAIEEALDIARQVAQGLKSTSAHGIVHRDIKPQNIMVSSSGEAKLMDFSIAGSTRSLGSTTRFLGTPYYIAPEQANPREEQPIDVRSDIYSLGAVLFEMLTGQVLVEMVTGQVPYDGDSPIRIAMQHIHESIPDNTPLRQEIPPRIEALVRRCLQKRKEDRFQTPAGLITAIDRSLSPPSPVPRTGTSLEVPGGPIFPLTGDEVRIGRRSETDAILPDIDFSPLDRRRTVSRRHAIITHSDDQWFIMDEPAVRNRTTVNGRPLKQRQTILLKDGDRLQMGDIILIFRAAMQ